MIESGKQLIGFDLVETGISESGSDSNVGARLLLKFAIILHQPIISRASSPSLPLYNSIKEPEFAVYQSHRVSVDDRVGRSVFAGNDSRRTDCSSLSGRYHLYRRIIGVEHVCYYGKNKEIYYSKALLIAGLVWTRMPYFEWLVFVFAFLAFLEYQAKLSPEIGFSTDHIVFNGLFKKKYPWYRSAR